MTFYCPNCDRDTIVLTVEEETKILDELSQGLPTATHRVECPVCHRYQIELAIRGKRLQ